MHRIHFFCANLPFDRSLLVHLLKWTDTQTDRHISTLAQRGHGWVAIQISRQHCKQFSLNQTLIVDRQTRMHSHAQDKQGPEACYLRNDFGTARRTKRACSSTALQRPSTNHTHLAERTGCEHKHAHRHTYTDTHWPLYLKLHYKLCRWWWSGGGATLLWGVTRQDKKIHLYFHVLRYGSADSFVHT